MERDEPTRWQRIWPHLRALLVAMHVLAITLLALPAPGGGMSRGAWKDPTVQGEFRAWSERMEAVGLDTSPRELEDALWEFAVAFTDVRRDLIDPFLPYYRLAGTWQSWRMFVAPHRHPAKLWIEIRESGGDWRAVYVARSPEYTWRRHQFDHDRMRSQVFRLSWPPYRRTWARFSAWIARQAAADFPEATGVRTRFYKYRTPPPQEARAGAPIQGRFVKTRVYDLEERR